MDQGRLVLLAGLALMGAGQTALFAIYGPLAREAGLSDPMIGGVVSLAGLTVMAAAPLWGIRSDRAGRRRVFALGIGGAGAATILFAFALEAGRAGAVAGWSAFALFAGARMLFGLFAAAAQPAAAGWIADRTPPERRTAGMALIGAAFGLGAIAGPALAWALASVSPVLPLHVLGGAALLAAVAAAATLQEPQARAERGPGLFPFDPRLRPALLATIAVFACVALGQQTSAFRAQDAQGLDAVGAAAAAGRAMALLALMTLAVQAAVARLRPSPLPLVVGGAAAAALGFVVLAISGAPAPFLVAHALFGLGFGAAMAGLQGLASLSVGPAEQGAAGGLVAAAMAAGFVIGPFCGTALYAASPQLAYGAAVAALLAVALGLAALRPSPGAAP